MLKPEYLQRVPDGMIKLYAQAEADILADMARRISTYDYWIPAVEHQAKMLEEAGMVREEILARLKTLTGRTDKELRQLMQEAGTAALKSDDAVYRRQGLNPPPVSASEDLQKVLQAGYEKTAGTFRNLTLTTARTATHQFAQALDRAYMQITLGGMDYNTAIRSTIKQLSTEGVGAIRYPTGRTDTIEVAVRRAVVTGVNQTALKLQDARADEMGADLVEVSAHAGARPSHAQWQGGIYSRSGKSKKYPDFVKTTGYGTGAGLGGWNCSHSFRPWFEGMSRTYDKALLKEYQAKDYEYNGVRMTEYEALQEQRKIERSIRRWKREQNALQAAGLDSSEASAKIAEWNRRQKDFLEQTGLKADGMRAAVGKGSVLDAFAEEIQETRIYKELTLEDFKGLKHSITKEERRIIYGRSHFSGYINSSNARKINMAIREGKELDSEYQNIAETLQSVINKNKVDCDIMVYRYVDDDALESITGIKAPVATLKMSSEEFFGKVRDTARMITLGHEYTEKGFLSTSGVLDKNVMSRKNVFLRIKVKSGTNAYISTNNKESEIIFGRNTKLKITKASLENEGAYNFKYVLDCEME